MYKYKKYICNNCGTSGHVFYNCKRPIMSFGLICFRFYNDELQYLMVRRKDTLGYVEFLRGKYNQYNDFHLKNIICEMTAKEIHNILTMDYKSLWNKLWNKEHENFDMKPIEKFEYVKKNKAYLFIENDKKWFEPEWGFPKGRRNNRETDYECAVREFEEETGYSKHKIHVIKNIGYFDETFTGSNMKSYKHQYYLCKMETQDTLNYNFQKSEIGDMQWFSYNECQTKIRDYNKEKKDMLFKINEFLNNQFLI